MFRVVIGLAFVAFGTCMLLHAEVRRRRWFRVSDEPIPKWQYLILGQRVSLLDSPSMLAIEQEGTVAQALAGAVSAGIGLAAVVAFA